VLPKQEHRIRCAEIPHGAAARLLLIGIFQGSNTSRETFIMEVAKGMPFLGSRDVIGVGFRHNPCRRASRLTPCLRLPENVASNSRYAFFVLSEIESCYAPVRVAFFARLDRWPGWRESQGKLQFLRFDVISSRNPITALNPATHPLDTCFQIVCGTQQSVVEGFVKMRVDLSVWEFRMESNFSDELPVPSYWHPGTLWSLRFPGWSHRRC